MTMSDKNECLKYKLLGDDTAPMDDWGHEYIRHLCAGKTTLSVLKKNPIKVAPRMKLYL